MREAEISQFSEIKPGQKYVAKFKLLALKTRFS